MPVRTRKIFSKVFSRGRIEPVYFLFGPETYLRERAADAIADEALRDTLLREFNDSSVSLTSESAPDAIAIAEQLPMMSSRRVVRIKNLARLRDADEEVLLKYLDRPVETSVVIFTSEDVDKRKKLARRLMSGTAFEFQRLKGPELQVWIKSHLKETHIEIEPPAMQQSWIW